jgi:HsdM N-terminal domain
MAIKKSDLYSSLWASCDELRGGMDASQYKDYVLFMLFIKYISDKYAKSNDFAPAAIRIGMTQWPFQPLELQRFQLVAASRLNWVQSGERSVPGCQNVTLPATPPHSRGRLNSASWKPAAPSASKAMLQQRLVLT